MELINEDEGDEDKSENEVSVEEVKKEINEIPSNNAVVTSTTARTGREYSREEFKSALRRLLEETPGVIYFAILNTRLFFHRFCSFKNNRISETLSLGEKSLNLAKNAFILMGEIWNFP